MKNEEVYKEVLEMKNKMYELCKENDLSMFVGVSNDEKEMLSGAANGDSATLQIMICEFLIEIFDEEEVFKIFSAFIELKESH